MANPERDSDTAYVELHSLSAGHSDTINCLAFSPDGVHLASGGDDYALIIWNALKGRLLYRLLFNASVGCVLWHPIHPETVIAGCDNGYLFQLHDFNLRTSQQHEIHLGVRSNIICLDYDVNHNYLAVGLGNEVHLTREVERNRYKGDKTLPPPSGSQEPSGDADSRLRPVSVHFLNNGDSLIVSYLRHGIVCWSTNTDAELWRITLPADTPEIGGSALSPDGRNLVVYNMVSGVARYAIGPKGSRSKPRQFYKLEKPARSKLRLHTSFLHDGRAIVCGTTTGQVCIWNVKTGEHFQLLTHAGDVVQAVATTQRRDTSFIATGSADKGQETYIKIWRAKIKRARTNPALEESVVRFVQALTFDNVEVDDTVSFGVATAVTIIIGLLFVWACALLPWRWIVRFTVDASVVLADLTRQNLVRVWETLRVLGDAAYQASSDCAQSIIHHLRAAVLSFLFPDGGLRAVEA